MINTELPVILLKKSVLLPHNELRLELDEDNKKIIIDAAKRHNDKVLVVTQLDHLEENTIIEDLPMVGVIANLKKKITLPNHRTRIVLDGLMRAIVTSYAKNDTYLVAIVTEMEKVSVKDEVNIAVVRKLKKEIEHYIKVVPYISNSVISHIDDSYSLDALTDMIVSQLEVSIDRKLEYVKTNEDGLRRHL